MDDLISRQDVLHELDGCDYELKDWQRWKLKTMVRDIPSAQPEPKTGKWIEKEIYETRQKEEMQVARCSNCKKYLTTPHIYSFNHYNYCPHCGTKMGG